MSSLSDRQLLQGVARQEERSLTELYERHSTSLYNYLFRLVNRWDVAEELLQEVFLVAWESAASFRGRAKVTTWLFRIAHHKAVDWLRKKRPDRLERVDWLPADDSPEKEVFDAWTMEQIQAALEQLSAKHRAVIELAFLDGLSYHEVARIVDCPVGTVKSRVCYARRYLRRTLEQMGVDW
jgi:RNA polymerase sigma-70 factor (ECF subfamily)